MDFALYKQQRLICLKPNQPIIKITTNQPCLPLKTANIADWLAFYDIIPLDFLY